MHFNKIIQGTLFTKQKCKALSENRVFFPCTCN